MFLFLFCTIFPATAFLPSEIFSRPGIKQPIVLFSAMERLHDTSTNAFGEIEHVYSLNDIDDITRKIADDEWMALGTAIAEAMYEMILEVSEEALHEMGFVQRMTVTNKISEDVASAVEVSRVWYPNHTYILAFLLTYSTLSSSEQPHTENTKKITCTATTSRSSSITRRASIFSPPSPTP